jgi:phosphoribosyl 1,2-cyclic phosphate phosphodiesterase
MALNALFAGTGTSVGIPMIGCRCMVCSSSDPRDTRCRSSLYLSTPETAVIIDTPPDFRQQMLRYKVEKLNAVVFTHAHADHFLGFDDIRRFNTLMGGVIPAYADPQTMSEVRRVFHYIGDTPAESGLYRPQVDFREITAPFAVGDLLFTPVEVEHGRRMTGYRVDHAEGSLGYVPDCCGMSEAAVAAFRGVDLMILDGLRLRPHPQHFHIARSVEVLKTIGAGLSLLTHICHDVSHLRIEQELPSGIRPAYDGLRVTLPGCLCSDDTV